MNDRRESKTTISHVTNSAKAVILSILLSFLGLIFGIVASFGLLFMGIAALPLPLAVVLVYGAFVACGVVPGIYANIYLTRRLPLFYRIATMVSYVAICSPIALMLFFWGFRMRPGHGW